MLTIGGSYSFFLPLFNQICFLIRIWKIYPMSIPNISEFLALLEVQIGIAYIHSTYIQDEHLDL